MGDYLISINFSEKNVSIVLDYCRKLDLDAATMKESQKSIGFLLGFGVPENSFIRMLKKEAKLLTLTIDELEKRVKDLEHLGYNKKEVLKLICANPFVLTKPIDYVTHVLDFLVHKKVKPNVARRATIDAPFIFDYTVEQLNNELSRIESLEFTSAQALKVLVHYPKILKKDDRFILDLIQDLMDCGLTPEEAKHLISFSKIVLRHPRQDMLNRIRFLLSLGQKKTVLSDSFALISRLELMKAKAKYLMEQGFRSPENLRRYMFASSKDFKTTFLVSPQELLITYRVSTELETMRRLKLATEGKTGNN